jgi:hypothetical protein
MTRCFRYFAAFAVTLFSLVGAARPAAAGGWGAGPIWDVKVIFGDSSNVSCGDGWNRIDVDLNKGAGGDYVYLCVNYNKGDHAEPINGLWVCYSACPQGYGTVWGEPTWGQNLLNRGAGGDPLHLGYFRGNITPLREIGFVALDSQADSSLQACNTLPHAPYDDWWPMPGVQDLNRGAGGAYIYPCVRYMPGGARNSTDRIWDLTALDDYPDYPNCPHAWRYVRNSGSGRIQDFNGQFERQLVVACYQMETSDPIQETSGLILVPFDARWPYTGALTMIGVVSRRAGSSTDLEAACAEQGGVIAGSNLNTLATVLTASSDLYFCISRAQFPGRGLVISGIGAIEFTSDPPIPDVACQDAMGDESWHAVRSINEGGPIDLNRGAGGSFIYACVRYGSAYRDGAFDGPRFNIEDAAMTYQVEATRRENGKPGAHFDYPVTATDAIDGDVAVNCTPASGSFFTNTVAFGQFPTFVTCTAADSEGNSADVTFAVKIYDTPPALVSPSDITHELGPGQTSGIVAFTAAATDKVDGVLAVNCDPPSGRFPVGVTHAKCAATDLSGLSAEGSFVVTMLAGVPPVLTLPGDSRQKDNPVSFAATASDAFDNASSPVTCSYGVTTFTPGAALTLPYGPTTITCSASDKAGNTTSGSFTVTLGSQSAPTFTWVPEDVEVEGNIFDGVWLMPNLQPARATDDYGDVPVTWQGAGPFLNAFSIGTAEIIWTAANSFGSVTAVTHVKVVDTTAPVWVASLPVLTFDATGGNSVTISDADIQNPRLYAVYDKVDRQFELTRSPGGFVFPVGSTTVAWTATDRFGNSSTAEQVIVVRDVQPPVFTVTGDGYIYLTAASSQGGVATYTINATDAIDGSLVATCSIPSGTMVPMGEHQVSCTATDRSGNAATRTFTLVMGDYEPPVMTAPAEVIVEATGLLTPVTFAVTALDAIAGPVEVRCLPKMGSSLPIGTTIVRCGADDGWMNFAEPSKITVIVRDTTPPVLSLPAAIRLDATSANGTPVPYQTSASDVVDGVVAPSCSPASGSTFAAGVTAVTCVARDAHGNTATGSFTIEVVQLTAPQLITMLDESIDVKRLDKRVQQILRSIDGRRDARACAQIAQLREAIAKDRKLSAADQQELLAQVDWLEAVAGCK